MLFSSDRHVILATLQVRLINYYVIILLFPYALLVGKFERICFSLKCLLSINDFAVLLLFKFQIILQSHGNKLQNVNELIYDAGHRSCYILVLVDCFTKFAIANTRLVQVLAYNIQSTISRRCFSYNEFWDNASCRLNSDNATPLISHQFSEYLRKREIIHRRALLFNPQAN